MNVPSPIQNPPCIGSQPSNQSAPAEGVKHSAALVWCLIHAGLAGTFAWSPSSIACVLIIGPDEFHKVLSHAHTVCSLSDSGYCLAGRQMLVADFRGRSNALLLAVGWPGCGSKIGWEGGCHAFPLCGGCKCHALSVFGWLWTSADGVELSKHATPPLQPLCGNTLPILCSGTRRSIQGRFSHSTKNVA
jgi:hypothetical protein